MANTEVIECSNFTASSSVSLHVLLLAIVLAEISAEKKPLVILDSSAAELPRKVKNKSKHMSSYLHLKQAAQTAESSLHLLSTNKISSILKREGD